MRKLVLSMLEHERMRFLMVGGINTLVGYGLFLLFDWLLGRYIGYLGSLYCSYLLATVFAFVLHRRFTFRATKSGRVMIDFLRFQSVYIVTLIVNTIALPLLVQIAGLHPFVAQACVVVVATIISYLGHRHFSFRRPRVTGIKDSEVGPRTGSAKGTRLRTRPER